MTSLSSFAQELGLLRRRSGVMKFGLDIIADEEGMFSYKLCAEQARHYTVKFKKGQPAVVDPQFTACDGACGNSKPIENASPALLFLVGIMERVPDGQVLVHMQGNGFNAYPACTVVARLVMREGVLISEGQRIKFPRKLFRGDGIDLTPLETRLSRSSFTRSQRNMVYDVVDTITNQGGKPVVTSTETELRKQQVMLERLADELVKKSGQDFAREASRFLRQECGFSKEQTDQIFNLAGPGGCRDAVDAARWALASNSPLYLWFESCEGSSLRGRMRARVYNAAGYIVTIGGVPVDKKDKKKAQEEVSV